MGLPDDSFDARPVIGICNTFPVFTPCNFHFRSLIEHIKRGVLDEGEAGFRSAPLDASVGPMDCRRTPFASETH